MRIHAAECDPEKILDIQVTLSHRETNFSSKQTFLNNCVSLYSCCFFQIEYQRLTNVPADNTISTVGNQQIRCQSEVIIHIGPHLGSESRLGSSQVWYNKMLL